MIDFDPAKFESFCGKLTIDSKEKGRIPLRFMGSQRYVVDQIADGLRNDIHEFVILKGRQLGISTVTLALDMYWLFKCEGLQAAIVTDTDDNRELFRSLLSGYIESLPPSARAPIERHNRAQIVFSNRSRLMYMVAGEKKKGGLGRAKGVNMMHSCCAPGTPVITEHGVIKPIEEVVIGDKVLTHTGAETSVIDVVGYQNTKGALVKITPWLGEAISYTSEHRIPTQRGIVTAGEIKKTDLLVMPVRKIVKMYEATRLPITPERPQGAGSTSAGSGDWIPLTEEFGYACGYYLSEGHITLQTGHGRVARASGIQFARHRSEKKYAKRAIDAIRPYIKSHRTFDRPGTLASVEFTYGASLSEWMMSTFGRTKDKHIPDAVFEWGEDFCRGLLAGILCGDGSKCRNKVNGKYFINRVTLPSIRSSIAMQTRDLAASLGYGWGSCSYSPERVLRDRNEAEQWRITWCGEAALKLRSLMGLRQSGGLRDRATKYKIVDNSVWIKIRKIERAESDIIWDLSVSHEDHTFRTPHMSTSNTECSSWGDEEGFLSLKNSLAQKNPKRLYVFESTARGYNMWFSTWEVAKKSKTQRAIFVGWWRNEMYIWPQGSSEFETYWDGKPTSDERVWIKEIFELYRVEITPEQLAWWRWYVAEKMNGDEMMALQEMPPCESYAFQLSGSRFFSPERVNQHYQHAMKQPCLYFRYHFGLNFEDTEFVETNAENAEVIIWETPVKAEKHGETEGKYVLGADPAYGSSEWADEFCGQMLRCYSDKITQVAELATPDWNEAQFAWALAHLAGWYGDCMLNLEMQGPGGAVFNELQNLRRQTGVMPPADPRLGAFDAVARIRDYLWKKQDSLYGNFAYQWQTNPKEKIRMMSALRSYFEREMVEINSPLCVQQFRNIHRVGDKIGGEGRAKDDRVVALAIGVVAWNDWIMLEMQATNRTFQREMRPKEEARKFTPLEHSVVNYLKSNGIKLRGVT